MKLPSGSTVKSLGKIMPKLFLSLLFSTAILSPLSHAGDLLKLYPKSTMICVEAESYDDLRESMSGTALMKMLSDEAVTEFLKPGGQKIEQGFALLDMFLSGNMNFLATDFRAAMRSGFAAGIAFGTSPQNEDVCVMLSAKTTPNLAMEFDQKITDTWRRHLPQAFLDNNMRVVEGLTLLEIPDASVYVCFGFKDGIYRFILSHGDFHYEERLEKEGSIAPVLPVPEIKTEGEKPLARVYLNTQEINRIITLAKDQNPRNGGPKFLNDLIKGAGINQYANVNIEYIANGKEIINRTHVAFHVPVTVINGGLGVIAGEESGGLFKYLGNKPVDEKLLKAVPQRCTYFLASGESLAQAPKALDEIAKNIDEPRFTQAVESVYEEFRKFLKRDIKVTVYDCFAPGTAIVAIEGEEIGGLPLYGLNGLALVASVRDKHTLAFGVENILGKTANAATAAALDGNLLKEDYNGVTIYSLNALFQTVQPAFAVHDDLFILAPTIQAVRYVIDTIDGRRKNILEDEEFTESFAGKNFKTVPYVQFSRAAKLQSMEQMTVTMPILAGMLLPALSRARDAANSAKSMNNLKQIGVAIALYKVDHQQKHPATLKELFDSNILTNGSVFICPVSGQPYRYCGALIADELENNGPIIWSVPMAKNGGLILFKDGHVEKPNNLDRYNQRLDSTMQKMRAQNMTPQVAPILADARRTMNPPPGNNPVLKLFGGSEEKAVKEILRTFPLSKLPPINVFNDNAIPSSGAVFIRPDGAIIENRGLLPILGSAPMPTSMNTAIISLLSSLIYVKAEAVPQPTPAAAPKKKRTRIPVSFVCSECNHITTFDSYPRGFAPFICEACGKRTAWEAYICNRCDPKGEHPYPHIMKLPKGVKVPEPGEEPSEAFMQALMRAEETPPVCPKCRRWRDVERYQTAEAKEIIAELRRKYQKKNTPDDYGDFGKDPFDNPGDLDPFGDAGKKEVPFKVMPKKEAEPAAPTGDADIF